jgi:DNA-binding NtrC family response regulator
MAKLRTTAPDVGSSDLSEAVHAQPALTLVYHADAERIGGVAFVLESEPLELGRAATAFGEGALDDDLVSRSHVRFERKGADVRIVDLESRNGTFVNGERLAAPRALAVGDVVGLGRVLLIFHRVPVYHQPAGHPTLLGVGAGVALVLDQIRRVAERDTTVLVSGETGSGKELVAREIHARSGRAGPFVAVNCGALTEGLMHSELFGHVRGAFSGADRDRDGLVHAAEGGTLLLDEIGDATPALQLALLRLLEQREYRAVGSEQLRRANVRFVAASHVPLARMVAAGRFREDLHARLTRWTIRVPPLRERAEDVVPLALGAARRFAKHDVALGRKLALAMLRYDWPANVRELESVVEQAVVEAEHAGTARLRLTPALAARLGTTGAAERDSAVPDDSTAVAEADRTRAERPGPEALRARFVELGGNVRQLAAELGVGRNTLYRWFREAGIDLQALRETKPEE